MEPCQKHLQDSKFRYENLGPKTLEKLQIYPKTVSTDEFQCNTIIHEPNSTCLTWNNESPTSTPAIHPSSSIATTKSHMTQGRYVYIISSQ